MLTESVGKDCGNVQTDDPSAPTVRRMAICCLEVAAMKVTENWSLKIWGDQAILIWAA